MIELWVDTSEEFYDHFFTYLKAKFTNEAPVFSDLQKSTNVCIYHETIVALEQVHRVLRAIENGSAYTREDFKKAVEKNDEQQIQLIINFCKQLALVENLKYGREFMAFSSNYYFDARIANYMIFLDSVDTSLLENLKSDSWWSGKNYKPDPVFDFISAYKNWLLDGGGVTSQLREEVSFKNNQAEELRRCIKDLIKSKVKIGVSQFDIVVPTKLEEKSEKNDELTLSEFRRFMDLLHENFRWDDGILLTINHVHKISTVYHTVSLLIIYKQNNYRSEHEVYDKYRVSIVDMLGLVRFPKIKIINRKAMIQKIYPSNKYIDNLNSEKQKNDFFNSFLKYFLSSIFVLNSSKIADEHEKESPFSHLLNDFKYYQEKIFLEKEKRASIVKSKTDIVEYRLYDDLEVLLDEPAFEKFDKYFAVADLPPKEIERFEILKFLYAEQGLYKSSNALLIEDIIKIECFMTRLMYNRQWKLTGSIDNQRDFEKKPKFSKLPILLKQLILIRKMECFYNSMCYQNKIHYSDAIFVLKRLKRKLPSKLEIGETKAIESILYNFTEEYLEPIIDKETVIASKAAQQVVIIQKYLGSIIEDDTLAVRFICSISDIENKQEANVFREMFTDFIENLKRRYTGEARLIGQVGVYIPSSIEHSIDVVLFFKAKESNKLKYQDVQIAVKNYWENYVNNKFKQIQNFNVKNGKKYTGNKTNPFEILKGKTLIAESRDVVSSPNSLNQIFFILDPKKKQTRKLIEELSRLYAHYLLIIGGSLIKGYGDRKHLLILGRKRAQ